MRNYIMGQKPVRHFPQFSVGLDWHEEIGINIMSNVTSLMIYIPVIDFVWIEFVTVALVLIYMTSAQVHCFPSNSCITESYMQWQ